MAVAPSAREVMRYLLFALLVSGCGLDRNIEGKVTIGQGVYGLLVQGCDSSGCQDQPAGGVQGMALGANSPSGNQLGGDIDQLRLFSAARTDAQIAADAQR